MDFTFTDEQELLRDSIKEFCERYIDLSTAQSFYDNGGVSDQLTMAYLETGFGLVGLPEEYGGIDCDFVTLGLLTEEFCHYSGISTPYLNTILAIRDMIDFGSAEQIQTVIDAYQATGKPIFSLGFSEPAAGSDNASMTSVTRKQSDGTYILTGQKTWVTNGETFPNVLVIAKDENPASDNLDMSMWLVPLSRDGVSTASLHKIGDQIEPFCDIYFDSVVLTEADRVGARGVGFKNLMKNYETERCLIISRILGIAQAAMDDAAAYVSERVTFGKPIASYQLIQEMLVEMEIKLQNTRNMLYKTLWKIDNGQSVRIDSALLKRYGAQACTEVCDMALQIYGGLGFTTETRLGRCLMDCRGMRIAGGTDEIMVYIAGRLLAKQYTRK